MQQSRVFVATPSQMKNSSSLTYSRTGGGNGTGAPGRKEDPGILAAAQLLLEIESPGRVQDNVNRLYYKDTEHRRYVHNSARRSELHRYSYHPTILRPVVRLEDDEAYNVSPRMDRDQESNFVKRMYEEDLRKRRQKQQELENKLYPKEKKVINKTSLRMSIERLYSRPTRGESMTQRKKIQSRERKEQVEKDKRPTWSVSHVDPNLLHYTKLGPKLPHSNDRTPSKSPDRAPSADYWTRLAKPRAATDQKKDQSKSRARSAEPKDTHHHKPFRF